MDSQSTSFLVDVKDAAKKPAKTPAAPAAPVNTKEAGDDQRFQITGVVQKL